MSSGSLSLAEYPTPTVTLASLQCGRQGSLRRDRLAKAHGADIALPDLLHHIAADCPRMTAQGNDRCGAYYVDLMARP